MKNATTARLRSDPGELRACLEAAGVKFQGNKCACPFHDDRHPSAAIHLDRDNVWRFHCHGPCKWHGDLFDVRAKLNGTTVEEELRAASAAENPAPSHKPKERVYPTVQEMAAALARNAEGELECVYPYREADGTDLMAVVRIRTGTGKTFRQGMPKGDGWVAKAPDRRPLMFLRHVDRADAVIVVEGEKAATELVKVFFAANVGPSVDGLTWAITTASGGAGNAHYTDWSRLQGKKRVVLWPDFDAPDPKKKGVRTGEAHMKAIAELLQQLPKPPAEISMIDPAKLGMVETGKENGEDAVEYLELYAGSSAEELRDVVLMAVGLSKPVGASSGLAQLIDDTRAGRNRNLLFGRHLQLTRAVRALMPETCTIVCGGPGSGKSFFVTDTTMAWQDAGYRPVVLMMEKSKTFHLNRALAQLAGRSEVLDSEWGESHADEYMALYQQQQTKLDRLAAAIHLPPQSMCYYSDVLKWMNTQADAGADILVIDPITKVTKRTERTDQEDHQFMMGVESLLQRTRVRVVFVTHPVKGGAGGKRGPVGMEAVAGGAAFERFADSMLLFKTLEKPKRVFVLNPMGGYWVSAKRFICGLKARNGPGEKAEIAMYLEPSSLRFVEQGLVDRDRGNKGETEPAGDDADAASEEALP